MKAEVSNIVNKKRHELSKVIPLKTPYSLFVDVCNACNFKCKFCAIQYSDKELPYRKMVMSFDTFKKVIDDLKRFPEPLKMLRLTANGEPLMNKELPKMIKYAKSAGVSKYIEIVSNGSLLNPKLNRELVLAGLNRIRISIEGINAEEYFKMSGVKIDWEKFLGNISDLYKHRGEMEIYIKIVDAAVGTDDKRKIFFETFGDICDKISIEHVIPIWTGWSEIKNSFNIDRNEGLHGHMIKNKINICPFPYYSFVVNPDGEVTVCCSDWERKISMGNAIAESVYDIWNGKKYHEFLLGMLEKGRVKNCSDVCAQCEYPCFDAVDDLEEKREEIIARFKA